MWTRKELKARGKAAFKANYWRCVLVALVIALISGGMGAASSWRSNSSIHHQQQQAISGEINGYSYSISSEEDLNNLLNQLEQDPETAQALAISVPIILGVIAAVVAVSFILTILVFNPLMVGCQRFFTENSKSPAALGEMGYGFKGAGYGRVVGTMLLTGVFLILWTLLFLIPGIIKAYSYRMVPYILAQEPELSGREAITRSRQMMTGNKWKTFVLDLSFILWILLSAITLGLVGVFYVGPYIAATNAELYHALSGRTGSSSFDGGLSGNDGVILNGDAL